MKLERKKSRHLINLREKVEKMNKIEYLNYKENT